MIELPSESKESLSQSQTSKSKNATKESISIDYFKSKDESAWVDIEQEAFPHGVLTISDMKKLRDINPFNLAARYDNQLLGYALFEKKENTIYIYRLAVHYVARRLGIGTSLINAIKKRLGKNTTKIAAIVYEDNLPGHLFLQKNGFRANEIRKDNHANIDMYYFEYFWSEEKRTKEKGEK